MKDGNTDHITREPEQVKAFRDTWRDGIQGYTWIEEASGFRRRLTVAEKNEENALPEGRRFITAPLVSQSGGENSAFPVAFRGSDFRPSRGTFWKTNVVGFGNLIKASRILDVKSTLTCVRYTDDFAVVRFTNWWDDTKESTFATEKYVVQTYAKVIERCVLMATDPGDLVLDPTCGSGTTAYVAEQWGRRWITIDTSRVALALARARIMGARYSYYLLADSPEGQRKEAEITGRDVRQAASLSQSPAKERVAGTTTSWQLVGQRTRGDIRQGFVYERVPHITLKSIANNAEIDVIWDKFQRALEPLCVHLLRPVGPFVVRVARDLPCFPTLLERHVELWATLNSDASRPFDKPASGRIAVINHLGDEVMKVFKMK